MPTYWQAARVYSYSLELTQPLIFAGNQLTHRNGLLLELLSSRKNCSNKSCSHWGEASPLPGFSHESLTQAKQQLLAFLPTVLNQSTASLTPALLNQLYPSVAFALSCATTFQPSILPIVNSTKLLQGEPQQIWEHWQQYNPNFTGSAKLKVARYSAEAELQLIQNLLKHSPNLTLHLDANQAWSLDDAIDFAQHLPKKGIRYIEEPITNGPNHLVDLESFYLKTGQCYALDETLQNSNYHFKSIYGLAMLVLKPSLIGSPTLCQKLIQQAENVGVNSTISSSFESDFALGQLNNFAQQFTANEAAGLDTIDYLKEKLSLNGQPDRKKLTLEFELS